ncbi:Ataxin-3 [Irineochytrium annulatum]|nr:Ataxin-3 [Irineochytrium annulatum]
MVQIMDLIPYLVHEQQGASENYDDSGFFSVQVLQKALETWNLTLEPIGSEAQKEVKADPAKADAFILNLSEHWFTIRRFGGSRQRFMNLNSLLGAPEPVTETYLSVLLNALEGEGYSVFVVVGKLPTCDADSFAARNPVPPAREPTAGTKAPAGPQAFAGKGYSLSGSGSDSDIALATALSMDGEDELQRAILMSMKESAAPTADEIRRKRLERFGG